MSETVFDPSLDIPEGLKGAIAAPAEEVFIDPTLGLEPYEVQNNVYDEGEYLRDDEVADDYEGTLAVPDNVVIVEQIVRNTVDGKSTVDVVLEVSDVSGARDYEIRVTKE